MSTSKYRVNVYVQTKNGEKILDKGPAIHTEDQAIRLTDFKNKNLGHPDPNNLLVKIGTKFAMYEDA